MLSVPRPGFIAALTLAFATAAAAEPAVYPAHGQSQKKQHSDEVACSKWAKSKTGYDPAHPPVPIKAEATPVTGSGARARGAAGGAIVGAIGGNAGVGAAAGAVAGGLTRRVRANRAADEQNEASAQHVAHMHASYDKAWGACLSGRGYSVR